MLTALFLSFFFLYYCSFSAEAQSAANFIIERVYNCENVSNQIITLIVKPKTFTLPQIVDITIITPIPIGNQLKLSAKIDLQGKLTMENWQHLVTIEDDLCRFFHMYMGPIAHDMETAMGIPNGGCPIPKAQSAANFIIENFYNCEDIPNQKVNLNIKPKTFFQPEVVDVTLITPIPLGNQLKISADIDLENTFRSKNWQRLVTIEDDFCRGHYHVVNYTVDWNMLRVQGIPFGKLRVTTKYVEKRDKNVISCIAQSTANLIIESSNKCKDVPNQKIDITVKPKTFFNPQVIDVTVITAIPIGNQLKFSIKLDLENKFSVDNWQHLVTIEDDYCRALQMYLGPLGYDILYAMGIPKGSCPIPKGHYHVVNYTMDLNMLRLQGIPFGKLRVTPKFIEKRDKNVVSCTAQSARNLIIESSHKCEDVPNQKIVLIVEPKTFSSPQVVDITLITPIPLGDQLKFSIKIDLENKFDVNNWQHLVTIEDDFCRAVQIYVGPIGYDILYFMGIPRTCPVPKVLRNSYLVFIHLINSCLQGHYHAVNYTMNLNQLKLQTIPFGKLHITIKFVEKRDKNVISCVVFIVSNRN
ncbi:hypothetical protein ILUMI_11038 [Ignelater luminosus]|uniref:Uncharacterized protein n=1 Tax=Ignelater luminosus TaxID=2038154 RepID=A0A8K0CWP7_IGNLU|nr:hypothetical protein ILUMI_11038 [Ignelater luminosus]